MYKCVTLRTSSMMRMFSGLISRWKMPLRCMWSMATHITIPLTSLPMYFDIYVLVYFQCSHLTYVMLSCEIMVYIHYFFNRWNNLWHMWNHFPKFNYFVFTIYKDCDASLMDHLSLIDTCSSWCDLLTHNFDDPGWAHKCSFPLTQTLRLIS